MSVSKQVTKWQSYMETVLRKMLYFGMAFLIAMATITVVHSVGRYVFDKPIAGLVEMSDFMLVIVISLAGAYTMVMKGHISVGLVVDKLPERIQAVIGTVTYLLSLMFTGIAAWQAFVRGTYLLQEEQTSEILRIPHYPFLYLVGIGWTLFSLVILLQLINYIIKMVKK